MEIHGQFFFIPWAVWQFDLYYEITDTDQQKRDQCGVMHVLWNTKKLEQFINTQSAMSGCVLIPASGWITPNSISESYKLQWKNFHK
jgi:hypothetical protein